MKRKALIPVLVAALALAGCMDDVTPILRDLSSELTFTASSPATKGLVAGTDLTDNVTGSRTLYISSFLHPQSGREDNYFVNEAFSLSEGYWRHDPKIYWPMGGQLDFLAYSAASPFGDFDGQWGTARWGSPDASARLRLAVGADRTQDDILFGALYHSTVPQGGGSVPMRMYHSQAWIEVTLGLTPNVTDEVVVSDVVLEGVYLRGDLDIENNYGAPERAVKWNFRRSWKEDVTVDDLAEVLGKPLPAGDPVSVSMLLPEQEMTTLRVKYSIGGVEKEWSQELPHAYWNMGRHYVYAILFDQPQYGDLAIEVTELPWETGIEFATYGELTKGNVLYATGDVVDLVGVDFDFSTESQILWRAMSTQPYTALSYHDGTWGVSVNYQHEEWDVNLRETVGDDYAVTATRQPRRSPLTITVTSPGTLYWMNSGGSYNKAVEYKVNDGSWTTIQPIGVSDKKPIILSEGDVVKVRGKNANYCNGGFTTKFGDDGAIRYEVSGNIMSMIDSVAYSTENLDAFSANHAFRSLFEGCKGLVGASDLLLPAMTLTAACYYRMFRGCTNLQSAPEELPALVLTSSCYEQMFNNCPAMTECASELPAEAAAQLCYKSMFEGCRSLVTGPAIRLKDTAPRGTNWDDGCCTAMFKGCSSMTSIPWTFTCDVAEASCYAHMFYGCSKLERGPEVILASEAGARAFDSMFRGCTSMTSGPNFPNLTKVSARTCWEMFYNCSSMVTGASELPAEAAATSCYKSMFEGCRSLVTGPAIRLKDTAPRGTNWDDGCCTAMFKGCSSMTSIPWTFTCDVAEASCYAHMFYGCSKLERGPEAILTSEAGARAFESMFYNCTAMTSGPNFPNLTKVSARTCWEMFYNCSSMVTGASELPATDAASECYSGMFYNCQSLATGPEIRLGNTAYWCCSRMFKDCKKMTTIPWTFANVTVVEEAAYREMFAGCSKLVLPAVTLPATTVKGAAYEYMFNRCGALTIGPEILAETFEGNYNCREMFHDCTSMVSCTSELKPVDATFMCYNGMFWNCRSLVTGPAIRLQNMVAGADVPGGNTDASNAYDRGSCSRMFQDCHSLTSIPWTFTTGDTAPVGCYHSMFSNCRSLTTPPPLPAVTLEHDCYALMFDSSGITAMPELPATTLAIACYHKMFYNCKNLVTVHDLPATHAASRCYYEMFFGCTNLVTAPDMMLTDTAPMETNLGCCEEMFRGCTKLEVAPHSFTAQTVYARAYKNMFVDCSKLASVSFELSAPVLYDRAYDSMFYRCHSLTAAPVIKATSLVSQDPNSTEPDSPCINMFYECFALNYVEVWATAAPSGGITNWMYRVPATGTFKCDPALPLLTGANGVPAGWTIVDL